MASVTIYFTCKSHIEQIECEGAWEDRCTVCSKALDTIKPADIKLVQSFKNPPGAIKLVMEAVCVLLDIKPVKVPDPGGSGKKIEDFWEPSKKALGDPNFVASLKNYDKDHINPKIIDIIRKTYTCNPEFTPANAAKASSAAEGLCKWVCAIERYEEVAKVVAPKQAALAIAQGEYDEVMVALNVKQVC
jgi:dynein heavy chain, axonemal